MNKPQKDTPTLTKELLKPDYWPAWVGAGVFRGLVMLPLPVQLQMGRGLGLLCYKTIKRRRHIAEVNIALCFPEKSKKQQTKMVKEIFANAGAGVFESLCAWWRPSAFNGLETIEGLEHFTQARAEGKPVLLLGVHSTVLDLGGLLVSKHLDLNVSYKPQKSAFLDWLVYSGRGKFLSQVNAKKPRAMAQSLREKGVLWYSPDQDFGLKYGVMSTFFGIPAATITASRRYAKEANAKVMALHIYRTTKLNKVFKKPHYHVTLTPVLENYPSADETADALAVNKLLESLIEKDLSQYMWFHRRFKTQPDGIDYYKK